MTVGSGWSRRQSRQSQSYHNGMPIPRGGCLSHNVGVFQAFDNHSWYRTSIKWYRPPPTGVRTVQVGCFCQCHAQRRRFCYVVLVMSPFYLLTSPILVLWTRLQMSNRYLSNDFWGTRVALGDFRERLGKAVSSVVCTR